MNLAESKDNKTYLVYDKCVGGSSAYNNELAKNITIDDLFSHHKCIQNDGAINEFNRLNKIKIPETILKHNGLYDVCYFVYTNQKNECRILLIVVDNILLNDIYTKTKTLPEIEFIKNVCNCDKLYRSNIAPTMNDEKLKLAESNKNFQDIMNIAIIANSDPTDPIEQQPNFANLPLYEYQKKTIKWMVSKELEKNKIYPNDEDIAFGNIVFNFRQRKFMELENNNFFEFPGGALIDEVGLGKTYQMITTSLINAKAPSQEIKPECVGTLIICPNQLVNQWINEIDNVVKKDFKKKCIPYFTKIHFDKYTYKDLIEADFVVTSFNFMMDKRFVDTLTPKMTVTRYNKLGNPGPDVKIAVDKMRKSLEIDFKNKLENTEASIHLLKWHRIVVDEFHEMYSNESYLDVSFTVEHFQSTYKWCLTGTPFEKTDKSLHGMINFVTGYSHKDMGASIWNNKNIVQYMKNSFFRRNTKQSVISENKQLPLIEKVVSMDFSNTERMIYNAYLANQNIDKFDITLRQLCCHPQIADDMKKAISDCLSLNDIEKKMVKFYEDEMNKALLKTKVIAYRIKCLHRRLDIAEWKQYARILRSKKSKFGFSLKFELEEREQDQEDEMQKLIKYMADEEDIELQFNEVAKFQKYNDHLKDDDDIDKRPKSKVKIITHDDKEGIKKMVAGEEDKTMERESIEDLIVKTLDKQKTIDGIYKGKKSTCEYFVNVMKKLEELSNVTNADSDSDDENEGKERCSICWSNITGNDLGVTNCGHVFCYNCIKPYIESKHSCPICRKKINNNELYMIIKNKIKNETQQEINDKQELVKLVGTKLANLIFFLKKNDKHCIIFSQWDDLLIRVGGVLNEYNIKNVFCRGNVWVRNKAIRDFNSDEKIKVIMLSSQSAASGTNLTKAEMVILLDPVYGTYEHRRNTEWQAIGRAYRTGQTKQVQVIRFIIKNTIEEEIYQANQKADIAIKKEVIELDENHITAVPLQNQNKKS